MGTCSSKTFLISVSLSKFRNGTIQETSLRVSVLRRVPLLYEIFGRKCGKGWTQLEGVSSPAALSRKCFKGNNEK